MSEQHSPEPWEVTEVGAGEFFIVKFAPGGDGWEHCVGEINRKEDADRICAAVNAVAGLDTETLEKVSLRDILKQAEWASEGGHWEEAACPCCNGFDEKHEPDCELGALLGSPVRIPVEGKAKP